MKSDVRTISGRTFVFVHIFVCKGQNVNFFNLEVDCVSLHQ